MARFNSPSNWPTPPEGWAPPDGWKPDPSWPEAPFGWQFWVEDSPPAPIDRPPVPEPEKRERALHLSFGGVTVKDGTVKYRRESMPLTGTTASVDAEGAIRQRATVTRAVLTGGIGALAFKKKVDDRELYLTIQGHGTAWVVKVDPKLGKRAREFAAKINAAS